MSLKHRFISIFAAAMVVGSGAVIASAQDTPPPATEAAPKAEKQHRKGFDRHFGRHGGKSRGMRGLRGIELTEEQKAQVKQIHEGVRLDPAAMEEMKALHEARRSGTMTEEQKARAATLRDQVRAGRKLAHEQILGILTPEQRQQLETRKAEMQKRREERRQQMHERRKERTPSTPATTERPTDN
ncbi:MAG: Spy/CpxP family protein refolding chaperone [Pyrinomonadaceae bacterium]